MSPVPGWSRGTGGAEREPGPVNHGKGGVVAQASRTSGAASVLRRAVARRHRAWGARVLCGAVLLSSALAGDIATNGAVASAAPPPPAGYIATDLGITEAAQTIPFLISPNGRYVVAEVSPNTTTLPTTKLIDTTTMVSTSLPPRPGSGNAAAPNAIEPLAVNDSGVVAGWTYEAFPGSATTVQAAVLWTAAGGVDDIGAALGAQGTPTEFSVINDGERGCNGVCGTGAAGWLTSLDGGPFQATGCAATPGAFFDVPVCFNFSGPEHTDAINASGMMITNNLSPVPGPVAASYPQVIEWSGANLPAIPPGLTGYQTLASNAAPGSIRWLNDNGDLIVEHNGQTSNVDQVGVYLASTLGVLPIPGPGGAQVVPAAINNDDTVVGAYGLATNPTAFSWTPTFGTRDLVDDVLSVTNEPAVPAHLSAGAGIANNGDIIAYGTPRSDCPSVAPKCLDAYLLVPAKRPWVDGVNPPSGPQSGPMGGGTAVHVTGGNFGPAGTADTVQFCTTFFLPTNPFGPPGGPACKSAGNVAVQDDTDLTLTTPDMSDVFAAAQQYAPDSVGLTSSAMWTDIIVTHPTNGTSTPSTADRFLFTAVSVTSVIPGSGPIAPTPPATTNQQITVKGSGFMSNGTPDIASVQFCFATPPSTDTSVCTPVGATALVGSNINVLDDNTLTVTTPDATADVPAGQDFLATDVVVTTTASPPATSVINPGDAYTFGLLDVTNVSPPEMPLNGGQTVTVTGNGFSAAGLVVTLVPDSPSLAAALGLQTVQVKPTLGPDPDTSFTFIAPDMSKTIPASVVTPVEFDVIATAGSRSSPVNPNDELGYASNDLSVSVSESDAPATGFQWNVTYSVTVTNHGPQLVNVGFKDSLPMQVMYGSASGGGVSCLQGPTASQQWTIVCNIPSISSDGSIEFNLETTDVNASEALTNTAVVNPRPATSKLGSQPVTESDGSTTVAGAPNEDVNDTVQTTDPGPVPVNLSSWQATWAQMQATGLATAAENWRSPTVTGGCNQYESQILQFLAPLSGTAELSGLSFGPITDGAHWGIVVYLSGTNYYNTGVVIHGTAAPSVYSQTLPKINMGITTYEGLEPDLFHQDLPVPFVSTSLNGGAFQATPIPDWQAGAIEDLMHPGALIHEGPQYYQYDDYFEGTYPTDPPGLPPQACPVPPNAMTVSTRSPVDVHLVNSSGQELQTDNGALSVNQLSGGAFGYVAFDSTTQSFAWDLGVPIDTYQLTLVGTGSGPFTLILTTFAADLTPTQTVVHGVTAPGQQNSFTLSVGPSGAPIIEAAVPAGVAPVPALAVAGVSPPTGPGAGGTPVSITGSGFSTLPGATTFDFGAGHPATAVSCPTSTQCTAITPPGAGTVDVTATVGTLSSTATTADRFTYAPVAVSPSLGPCAASADAAFLCQVYQDLLGRLPDPGGLSTFNGQLAQGWSRERVANALLTSTEYRQDVIEGWYHTYLGRTADPGGLAHFAGLLGTSASDEGVQAAILGSQEYVTTHGGTAGFVPALYQALLGRAPDQAGLTTWNALMAQGMTPMQLAGEVMASIEYRDDIASLWYERFLARPADPDGLAHFVGFLAAGSTDESVIAQILGSPEYLARATSGVG